MRVITNLAKIVSGRLGKVLWNVFNEAFGGLNSGVHRRVQQRQSRGPM